jgi:hypothetical protein
MRYRNFPIQHAQQAMVPARWFSLRAVSGKTIIPRSAATGILLSEDLTDSRPTSSLG